MSVIIGLILVIILLCGHLLRAIFGAIGLAGLAALAICIYMLSIPSTPTPAPIAEEGTAADYRAAQRAVAKATGRPCNYACKEMIADRARVDLPQAD